MKIESEIDDNTFFVTITAIIATFLLAFSIVGWYLNYQYHENMARMGYEEVTTQGRSDTVWQKPHSL